jgi:sugar phosphate isomerase/epimerase
LDLALGRVPGGRRKDRICGRSLELFVHGQTLKTPIISINTLCLEPGAFDAHVAAVVQLGAMAISPERDEILTYGPIRAAHLLRDAGVSVATLTHRAFGFATSAEAAVQRRRLAETIDLAHAIGAPSICMTSGPRGELSWKEAATRFAEEIAACAAQARSAGISLGLEPTSHLYSDASIAHRLADTVTLARESSICVGLDLFPCWMDSDIEETIAAAGPMCAFVQVSDYVLGDRGLPCRAVPGDGAVPLDRLIRLILNTGYRGPFDIEVIGPRLLTEGREAGLRRAIARVEHLIKNGMQ